ncbi:unnamed protein product [Triticum turgidum subsp. durum]|uniref:Cytochrome P450 n=1 Tax=Triticum turgidum subsp. durum TaxID=4567 RepID=A0A9R0RWW9_TRITD|nr:unnamed protein product [Triticum turgidum subsp. durum]
MEVLSMFSFIAQATILFLLFLKLTAYGNKSKLRKKQLPPGPWSLPFIGSLHHVLRGLPHRTMRELSRRHGPLMFLRLGEVPTLVVSSAEAAELVMRTHDLSFASRPSSVTIDIIGCCGKGIGFAPYGDRWRQMKKICIMELLNAKQVKRVESIRAEEVGGLFRSFAAASGFVNLSKKASALANDIVAMAMFGGKCAEEKSEFVLAYDQVSELVAGFFPLDFFLSSRIVRRLSTIEHRLRGSYGCIQRIIASIVESRNAEIAANGDQEDFLGVLLRLQKKDSLAFPLTPETIGAIMFVSTPSILNSTT